MKDVNLETNIGSLSWYKTWQLSGSNLYPCKNKNFSDNGKELTKVLRADEEPKVMYTDNSLEFGKSCEELCWNHCTPTPHNSETNGIAERAVRRIKEGTSAVLLQSGLEENGRRIPQSVPAIFGTYKISCLMRRVVIRRPI